MLTPRRALMKSFLSSSKRRASRRVAVLAGLLGLVALASPACNSSSNAGARATTEGACKQSSDCTTPYICALGACRAECKTAADCQAGGSCVTDGTSAVCQSAADKNTACNTQSDCTAPLACASDYRCRNLCASDGDCNVLDVTGRVCAKDANGVEYCADPPDVHAGKIISTPPPGASDTPVVEPDQSNGGSAGQNGDAGDTSVGGKGNGGGGASNGGAAPAHGGSGPDTPGSAGEAGAAGSGPAECMPGCVQGQVCLDGACKTCGAADQPCCEEQTCKANLSCGAENTCKCGGANQACCGGSSCGSGLSCDTSKAQAPVCACGSIGTSCCPGADVTTATCSGSASCAGLKCSCLAEVGNTYGQEIARRVDGTVWKSVGGAFTRVENLTGPLVASAVAVSYGGIGCAVTSGGSVWCFPMGASISNSTHLGAGLGATDTTSVPVQVVTAVGGAPLTGVQQIAGANRPNPSGAATFCAVATDGSVWCWGDGTRGQMGRGDTVTASFARKVLDVTATPFAGAVEVSVGVASACARKTDGSVWCWGTSTYGELGVPPATLAKSYYPVKVPLTGSVAQRTATHLSKNPFWTPCAVMQDGSVVCWGYNPEGAAGAPPSAVVGPTTIVLAAGGSALSSVLDVTGAVGVGATNCARTATLDVFCWGDSGANGPYPTSFAPSGQLVSGLRFPLFGFYDGNHVGGGVSWVSTDGQIKFSSPGSLPAVPCTDLLP